MGAVRSRRTEVGSQVVVVVLVLVLLLVLLVVVVVVVVGVAVVHGPTVVLERHLRVLLGCQVVV